MTNRLGCYIVCTGRLIFLNVCGSKYKTDIKLD